MKMVTVTREEFMRGAAGIIRRSETEGPIGILNEKGEVSAIVHAPTDDRSTDDEERELKALLRQAEDRLRQYTLGCACPGEACVSSCSECNQTQGLINRIRDILS